MPQCNAGSVPVRGFCEADGECGISMSLDNCNGWDVLQIVAYAFTSGIPIKILWDYLYEYAAKVRELLPHDNAVRGKRMSTYEFLYDKKPVLSHLRVIGCVVHAFLNRDHRPEGHTFGERSVSGIFVGFPSHILTGVYIWRPGESKVIVYDSCCTSVTRPGIDVVRLGPAF